MYTCVSNIFFIHSPFVDTSWFHILPIVHNEAMNTRVQDTILFFFFYGYIPKCRIFGSCNIFNFLKKFWGTSILFSILAPPIFILNKSAPDSFFFPSSPALAICYLFEDSHCDRYKVIPHCGFHLHFFAYWRSWLFFYILVSHLYVCFVKQNKTKGLFISSAHFKINYYFRFLSCMST